MSQYRTVGEALPEFAKELKGYLETQGYPELAAQVDALPIVLRCGCGDDFCAAFYTDIPKLPWGSGHRSMQVDTSGKGIVIVDTVHGAIKEIEVLYRDDVTKALSRLNITERSAL